MCTMQRMVHDDDMVLEIARIVREAEAAVRRRMAESQLGELFAHVEAGE